MARVAVRRAGKRRAECAHHIATQRGVGSFEPESRQLLG